MTELTLPETAQPAPAHRVGDGPKYERLTIEDIGLILRLHTEGKTQVEIAQRLGKHQASISRVLTKLGPDSTGLAETIFKSRAYRTAARVTRIAEKSQDHDTAIKAAKVVLEAAGLTGQRVSGTGQVNIQVNVGMPGKPAGPDPLTVEVESP